MVKQLQQGYRCTGISSLGTYTFEKADEDYVMRLDYQNYMPKDKFEDYKTIYEDFGWVHVKGSRFGSIQYWQKIDDGQTEIFSDRESYSNYYKRLMVYTFSLMLAFTVICFTLYKDSGIYLTEGLWEMEGSLFWKALVFETPFAFLRFIPLIVTLLFGLNSWKAYRQYTLLKDK